MSTLRNSAIDTPRRRGTIAFVLLLATLLITSCLSPPKRTVFDDGKLKVQLRSRKGEPFEHPVIISPVRLSHILARLDIRSSVKDGQRRVPAIPLVNLEPIANGLAKGLAEAQADQEVLVSSVRIEKRWGVFNHDKLTSFVAYQQDDVLFIHLSRSDWEVPKRREERLPEPEIGEFPMKFRILAGQSMEMVDQQSVAIDWRAPLFDMPTRTRVTPDGRTVRREILMESDVPEDELRVDQAEELEIMPIPAGVSPSVLRALADLEEQRRSGAITESAYARMRLELIEAGVATEP